MSQDTYEDDDTNHDYLEEDVGIDNFVIPSSNIDNFGGKGDNDAGEGNAKPFQVQIAELEVEYLTTNRVILQTHRAQYAQSSGSAFAYMDVTLRSYASEQWSRRRRISKQQ
jgi:hypothetical protein